MKKFGYWAGTSRVVGKSGFKRDDAWSRDTSIAVSEMCEDLAGSFSRWNNWLDCIRAASKQGSKYDMILTVPRSIRWIGFGGIGGQNFWWSFFRSIYIVVENQAYESSHDLFSPYGKICSCKFDRKVSVRGNFNYERHDREWLGFGMDRVWFRGALISYRGILICCECLIVFSNVHVTYR